MDLVYKRALKEVDLNSCESMTGLALGMLYFVCFNKGLLRTWPQTFNSDINCHRDTEISFLLTLPHTFYILSLFPLFSISSVFLLRNVMSECYKSHSSLFLCLQEGFSSPFKGGHAKWAHSLPCNIVLEKMWFNKIDHEYKNWAWNFCGACTDRLYKHSSLFNMTPIKIKAMIFSIFFSFE